MKKDNLSWDDWDLTLRELTNQLRQVIIQRIALIGSIKQVEAERDKYDPPKKDDSSPEV